MTYWCDEGVARVNYSVVDTPRINSDAGKGGPALRDTRTGMGKTCKCLLKQVLDIPAQHAVNNDRGVRKPMNLVEGEAIGSERSKGHSPARGSEVNRGKTALCHMAV